MNELHKPGVWSLPGGKVEDTVEQDILNSTLKTELMEEVNIEIANNIQLVKNNAFRRVDKSHVVNLTFMCEYVSGEPKANEDTSEIAWFTIEELENFADAEDWLIEEIKSLKKYLKTNGS